MVLSERLDIYTVLLFMSVGQMLASVMFLSFRKKLKRDKSSWFLVAVLIILSFNILEPVLIWTRLLYKVPHLLYIGPSFLLLLGPFILWHFLALRETNFRWKPIYFLHGIPFVLLTIQKLPRYFQSASVKREILDQFYAFEPAQDYLAVTGNLMNLAIQLHPIIYVLIALALFKRESQKRTGRLTSAHGLYLISLGIALFFYLFGGTILTLFGTYSPNLYWAGNTLLMYGFVCVVGYLILSGHMMPASKKSDIRNDGGAERFHEKLTSFMKEERPYLSSTVSLNSMSQLLDVTPNYLSRVIREFEHKSFLEFINSHRVEAVKSLIISPEMSHYTLEAIGQEAGFSNKMSLNRAFKKFCGKTPSDFRNEAIQRSNP